MSGGDRPLAARVTAFGRDLPLPGGGRTALRWQRLWAVSADPTFGRLAEAHADALAILAEAGCVSGDDDRMFGVWAARGTEPVRLVRDGARWWLRGQIPWCSGVGLVDAALVAAQHEDAAALVVVSMDDEGAVAGEPDWQSPAFPSMDTRTVDLDVHLDDAAVVAVDDWYLSRPGFWHGAVGVAACWAGAAAGLVDRVRPTWRTDAHAVAHLGAIDAALWQLAAVLDAAGVEIDAAPQDHPAANRRALRVRHVVDTTVAEITDRLQRALGPTPLVRVPGLHQHLVECDLLRRQCHAERDLETLGRLTIDS